MQSPETLIEVIRSAVVASATPAQREAGAAACRTLLAVLGTAPGAPLAASHPAHPLAQLVRLPPEQLIELIVSKLRGPMLAERAGAADSPKPAAKPDGGP